MKKIKYINIQNVSSVVPQKSKKKSRVVKLLAVAKSESNPNKSYKISRLSNGRIGCECPAWVFNHAGAQEDGCKHIQKYLSGELTDIVEPAKVKNPVKNKSESVKKVKIKDKDYDVIEDFFTS